MTDESSALAQPYQIVSVRRANPAPVEEGSNWHRYVIAFKGTNTIHGYIQGNFKAVMRAVEEIIAQLNEKHWWYSTIPRRVNRVPTPKKKTHK